jgi:FkbM family methyltransferase
MDLDMSYGTEAEGKLPRMWRFLRKPWPEKANSARFRWSAGVARIPKLMRLPSGAWWVLRKDNLGKLLRTGSFETVELAFVDRFLRPGMTVLDLGAHHGLYTLLASKRVGKHGRVISFEPSPRERRALRLHVAMNRCWNVEMQGAALGDENTDANLFVVQGGQTGCNSLRPPVVESGTAPVRVRVMRLDDWLAERKISQVDFIKLDVEGAELTVLKGATKLFKRQPRPVLLVEVQDVRTRPWGYAAKEILEFLAGMGYTWFRFSANGSIEMLSLGLAEVDGNFVACPEERFAELRGNFEVRHTQ